MVTDILSRKSPRPPIINPIFDSSNDSPRPFLPRHQRYGGYKIDNP